MRWMPSGSSLGAKGSSVAAAVAVAPALTSGRLIPSGPPAGEPRVQLARARASVRTAQVDKPPTDSRVVRLIGRLGDGGPGRELVAVPGRELVAVPGRELVAVPGRELVAARSEGGARALSTHGRVVPALHPPSTGASCWASTARCALHWWLPEMKAWLSEEHAGWGGWDGQSAVAVERHGLGVQPWRQAIDTSGPPFARWFRGALTSAAFNEVDRSALAPCRSVETSFFFDDGAGAPVGSMSCRELLRGSVVAALSVREPPLAVLPGASGSACALPNGPLAIVWAEALKRCAVPFVATAAGSSASSLTDRVLDTRAHRAGGGRCLGGHGAGRCARGCCLCCSRWWYTLAGARAEGVPPRPDDVPAEALLGAARDRGGAALTRSGSLELVRASWSHGPAQAVEAASALFILYTSGSTGKPKGVVHTHAGYHVGLCATSSLVLGLVPGEDVMFVVATTGWITGQSYMVASSLLRHVPSVVLGGSIASPAHRFAAVVERHAATVLKAGSTFIRMFMTQPGAGRLLADFDLSTLRLGVFCAEPVNEIVHAFACRHVCAQLHQLLLGERARRHRVGVAVPAGPCRAAERVGASVAVGRGHRGRSVGDGGWQRAHEGAAGRCGYPRAGALHGGGRVEDGSLWDELVAWRHAAVGWLLHASGRGLVLTGRCGCALRGRVVHVPRPHGRGHQRGRQSHRDGGD